jgi:hypothetical protein
VGTVEYEGSIGDDGLSLSLHSRSLINGHESDTVYEFVQVAFPEEAPTSTE